MFQFCLSMVLVAIILGVVISFWKYRKLESIVKNTRIDLDNCELNINIINTQLNAFKDTIKKIDSQITTMEKQFESKSKRTKKSDKPTE